MNLVLIGPYGVGKGTQAIKLSAKFDLCHISTGDLFREHLRKQTELGTLIQKYLDNDELVPDHVAEATMEEWLVCSPKQGILFYGFPRTLNQAKFLERIFIELSRSIDAVIYMKAPDAVMIKRLSESLVCKNCLLPFHHTLNPFTSCPYRQCNGEHLHQPEENAPEKLQTRLNVFHQETEPLVDYYRELEKLVVVDGDRNIDQVHQSIVQALLHRFK